MSRIDVSVVLNIHRESVFLRPTLLSLNACALEANISGIVVELVAVFDRSDTETMMVFNSTTLDGFRSVKTIKVDVGSLGLARNAGIEKAEGIFVWTADADDLVSGNAITELVKVARNHPNNNVAIFIQYLVAFGDQFHVARYFDSKCLTVADFAYHHPYVSRVFILRSVFEKFHYKDLKVTSGFAYEDWDFNCRLLAEGFEFKVAPDTVFFYRQRSNSLLRQANALSARMIPHSPLFEPKKFRSQMAESRKRNPDWAAFISTRQRFFDRSFAQELLTSKELVGHIIEAAQLDPEIEPGKIETAHNYCPIPWNPRHWGAQLERLYELIGDEPFSDVVLMPWLKPGGAEKYILQILDQLHKSGYCKRILVFTGHNASKHEWVKLLPKGSVFVDLFNSFPMLDEAARETMAARALLAVSMNGARLHLKASEFAHRMMDAYGAALSSHFTVVYYRFCDYSFVWEDRRLFSSWAPKFLRRQFTNIDLLICDCQKIVDKDADCFGARDGKYQVIYAGCEVFPQPESKLRQPKRRLLWASRISPEKRPELAQAIANALHPNYPDMVIEVYGQIEGAYTKEVLFNAPGVIYRGSFDGFNSLPIEQFDALIYTSASDGLPNIILEAMASNLPVIAPDVGGIGETVINNETGFLVPDLVDNESLISAFVDAVHSLYHNWDKALAMAENGRRLIAERHGEAAFNQRVADVFGSKKKPEVSQ